MRRHTRRTSPSPPKQSQSSSLGGDEDPSFLDALATLPLTPYNTKDLKNGHRDADAASPSVDNVLTRQTRKSELQQRPEAVAKSSNSNAAKEPDPASVVTRSHGKKRARFAEDEDDEVKDNETKPEVSNQAEQLMEQHNIDDVNYLQSDAYKALRFGDFSTYMRNKRAKLKVQERSLQEQEDALLAAAATIETEQDQSPHSDASQKGPHPQIFTGCTIYVNGHTVPPYSEIRRLIVLHGGNFMAYLDQKGPVTHIVASNLTPKKRVEFAAYKVILPEWVTDSIAAGKKLPWHNYRVEADSGGAIGQAKLPGVVQGGSRVDPPASGYLANEELDSKESNGSVATVQPSRPKPYLAEATPWGRLAGQKKLTGFAKQQRVSDRSAANDSLQSSLSPVKPQLSNDRSPSKSPRPSTPSPTSPQTPRADKLVSQLSEADLECLQSLETPPRPTRVAVAKPTSPRDDGRVSETELPSVSKEPASIVQSDRPVSPAGPSTPAKDASSAIGTDPVTRKAAVAAGQFNDRHPYAKNPTNLNAAKLLASPSWREQHTATSESFLSGYFAKSRLHYLSTWKGELKDLVSQALKDSGREAGSQALPKGVKRVIMHIDFDSFFVSVGLRDRPDLKDKPVVVCHAGSIEGLGAGEASTSEIASCNYAARKFGVQNGWSLGRARQLCPTIHPIPYDFEGYKDVSIHFYSLLLAHADAIEAVSVDEALIDVSILLESMRTVKGDTEPPQDQSEDRKALLSAYRGHLSSQGDAWDEEKQLAEALRDEIRRLTRCEASVGIGSNTLQARLATRYAKPAGSHHLREEDLEAFLGKLDIDDLQGVGYNTRNRFQELFGTINIAELKQVASQARFCSELGPKLGKQVWDKMFGIDRAELEGAKQRQSVGAAVNYAIRFSNVEESEKFIRNLSEEVSTRLKNYKLKGKQLNTTIMIRDPSAPVEAPKFLGHGICDVFNRSQPLSGPGGVATNDVEPIFKAAWKLIRSLNADPRELRGIAISCTKLESTEQRLGPPKPTGGQSLLNFTSPVKQLKAQLGIDASSSGRTDPRPDAREEPEDQDQESPLRPGPFELSQRDTTQQSVSASPAKLSPERGTFPARAVAQRLLDAGESSSAGAVAAAVTGAWMPTLSQMDQSVLSELPPSIRAEVLRESKRLGSSSTPRSSSRLAANDSSTARSVSSSPTKRSLTHRSPSHQRVLPFLGQRNQAVTSKPRTVAADDPTKVTADELKALEIDPEVFAALPLSLQRETLAEQGRIVKGREARFIQGGAGSRGKKIERTMAEERRSDRDRAMQQNSEASNDGSTYLVAKRVGQSEVEQPSTLVTLPSIQKKRSEEEVRSLLTAWIKRHTTSAPRPNDVARFSKFLTESVSPASAIGSGFCQLETVQALLQWWGHSLRYLLPSEAPEEGASGRPRRWDPEKMQKVRDAWKEAFEQVRGAVDEAVLQRFGGRLGMSTGRF